MKEEDIYAAPKGSSDEEEEEDTASTANASSRAKNVSRPEEPLPLLKRQRTRQQPTRSFKRPRLQNQPDLLEDVPQHQGEKNTLAQSSAQSTEWEMFESQGPAPRRSQNKFKNKYQRLQPSGPKPEPKEFKTFEPMPDESIGNEKTGPTKVVIPTLPEKPAAPRKVFKTFALPSVPPESSAPSQSSGQSEHHQLSESSPPSTPVSETGDHEVLESPAAARKQNICPLCKNKVIRSHLKDPGMNIQEVYYWPMRNQRVFCNEHTLADARILFAEHEFPEINFFRLKTERIPKHTAHLKSVMYRRIPSHFLEEVDAQIPDKNNRQQVRDYFNKQREDEIAVPTGYYGAKGAQIMAEGIAQELSRFMKGKVAHELIKAIGVGPFIANVLVPELTQRLIMEDLKLQDEAKARTIMHESTYAGMILHPEDEKVERHDDD